MDTPSDYPPTLTIVRDADDVAARLARLEALVSRMDALLFGTERWMPVSVAAERLGVSRTTVYSWLARGHDIPARRFNGTTWEIDPAWVAAQAATRRTNSPRKD